MDDIQFKIALNLIPQFGPRLVRRLVSYSGGVEAVFREKRKNLEKIPGVGAVKASLFDREKILKEAEEEVNYILAHDVIPLFFLDDAYPRRLRECEDGPVILYTKGKIVFNAGKVISIVGTRKASAYGKSVTEEIIAYLAERYPEMLVVSGLAYGIDITAHKAALSNDLMTVAALGHGLEYLYPGTHRSVAKKICEQGALVTEFQSTRKPDPGNFVSRNRIIAGLADATIIIESAEKGGALITADLANSYNRDVFAVPGRGTDNYSRGCNKLIRSNKAILAECGQDIEEGMGWIRKDRKQGIQKSLFYDLSMEEKSIMSYLEENGDSALDTISLAVDLPVSRLSALLLNLEFNGLVRTLPGKVYRKN